MDRKKILSQVTEAAKTAKSKVPFDIYTVVKAASHVPMKGLLSLDVSGVENVPTTGPVILAANHRSFTDSIFIPYVLKRKVVFVAKAEYFDSVKTRWIFKATGQIPVRRDGGDAAVRALLSAKEVLDRGEIFAIYPEGTRTRDGFIHRGHTGVARLAIDSNAALIPIGLVGTENVQATNEKFPRFGKKVGIHFGEPINVHKYRDALDSGLALRNLTDELMYEIFRLCNYGYVDTYSPRSSTA